MARIQVLDLPGDHGAFALIIDGLTEDEAASIAEQETRELAEKTEARAVVLVPFTLNVESR
ncbi:hypothetical protein ACMA1D_10835 [Streptomyces sp. 796.1]|uniref:hypothetical protein n=1 Tax=Streptomyces sp. 796.1 TaxID=3163029 RepID=UPI0039C9E028